MLAMDRISDARVAPGGALAAFVVRGYSALFFSHQSGLALWTSHNSINRFI
jgi:hypothetical protein